MRTPAPLIIYFRVAQNFLIYCLSTTKDRAIYKRIRALLLLGESCPSVLKECVFALLPCN